MKTIFNKLLIAGAAALPLSAIAVPVSLTVFEDDYVENFTSPALASSGTSSTLPQGWEINRASYTAGNGSVSAGGIRSYGQGPAQVDRALGSLTNDGEAPLIYGVAIANNTGGTIGSIDVQYIGEQWRRGANNSVDRLLFSYSLDAMSITDAVATWVSVSALDFVSPRTGATAAALNGNVTGTLPGSNRALLGASIDNLSIADGSVFYIRYMDTDVTGGVDHGLAVDDFQVTPFEQVPVPASLFLFILGALGLRRHKLAA